MRITLLGTGTSQGVPLIGCTCEVCRSEDAHDKRLRCSVFVETQDLNLVIDTGPDFRYQMLRAGVKKLDAVLLTHSHKDHLAGLDDIRAYNYFQHKPMDIYASTETLAVLKKEFSYVFDKRNYPGIPQLELHSITNSSFKIGGLEISPIRVLHFKMEVFGYRIGDFTYITDANSIAPEEIEKCKGTEVLVLNALRHEKHVSHFTLSEAIEIAREIGATRTYFTHISHQLGRHEEVEKSLPDGMFLAYDGLEISI